MDIETMCFEERVVVNKNNVSLKHRPQTPVLITCTYKNLNQLVSFYTKINTYNFKNVDDMVKDL
jgi:hypothetical protein